MAEVQSQNRSDADKMRQQAERWADFLESEMGGEVLSWISEAYRYYVDASLDPVTRSEEVLRNVGAARAMKVLLGRLQERPELLLETAKEIENPEPRKPLFLERVAVAENL